MGRARWIAGLIALLLPVACAAAGGPDGRAVEVLEPVLLQAQDPPAKDGPKGKDTPKGKESPKGKDTPKGKEPPKEKEPSPPNDEDAFAQRTNTGGDAPLGSYSRMMGDLMGGIYATRLVTGPGIQYTTVSSATQTRIVIRRNRDGTITRIPVTTVVPINPVTTAQAAQVTARALVPVLGRSAFKIGENESPAPEDRVFLTYNNFQNIPGAIASPVASTTTLPGGIPGQTTSVLSTPYTTVQRQVIGFEATYLDGAASVGMRAPFFQQQGNGSVGVNDFGDASAIFKFLAYRDGADLASFGLVVTLPTGPAIPTVGGNMHPTLLQPWVGGYVSDGVGFAMGFVSVVVPTDGRDTTLLCTDVGVGFLMYQDTSGEGFISLVAPKSEVHVTTPLNHRNGTGLLSVPDLVVLTQGVQVGFGAGYLTLGVAFPVTGPRPFDLEALVQLNYRF